MELKALKELTCLWFSVSDQEREEEITVACSGLMRSDRGTFLFGQVINVNSIREERKKDGKDGGTEEGKGH